MISLQACALTFDILYALAVHHRFNRHEPSLSWGLLPVFIVPLLSTWVLANHTLSFKAAFLATYSLFFTTLFTSIVVYRLSPFHPLASYPGPIMCKISQLWTVVIYSRGKAQHYRKRLHDQYGPIVRIGPNELSVTDKDMFPYILGSQGMPRGPLFEGRQVTRMSMKQMENLNLIGTRDLQRHAVLRKVWNKAFSEASLNDYEELLRLRAYQLINALKTICKDQSGVASVDIAAWIGYFTFDFMGDMAFGGGFELMRSGDSERLLPNIARSLYYACLCQAVPWFSPIMRKLPYFGAPMRAFGAFGYQRAKMRYEREPERKDLFYHLIAAHYADSQESPLPFMISNSILAIIAGSDTTSTALRNAVFYLLANPAYYVRVREEIDAAFPPTETSPLDTQILPSLPLLNAVMYVLSSVLLENVTDSSFLHGYVSNEVLRLQPPVPTGLQRAPARGSGGKLIGSRYFKEGTQFQVPPYVLHRDPRYFFPRPDEFWPDRWLSNASGSQDFVLDRSAFIPFSMGPANCVGKSLAMLELRMVITLFITHFDMEFDDSFVPATWIDSLQDCFVLQTGELTVKLRLRRRASIE